MAFVNSFLKKIKMNALSFSSKYLEHPDQKAFCMFFQLCIEILISMSMPVIKD